MSTIYYHALGQPTAQALESAINVAVNNSRLQGVQHDISMAQTDNSFKRTKDLINNIPYGTIKTD